MQNSLCGCDTAGDFAGYELEGFIDTMIEAADAGREKPAPPQRSAPDYRVRKAVELMKANVTQRVCFDTIARSVGLSRPHFFALFREQMNPDAQRVLEHPAHGGGGAPAAVVGRAADRGRLQPRLHHPGQFLALLPRSCRRAADGLSLRRPRPPPEPDPGSLRGGRLVAAHEFQTHR